MDDKISLTLVKKDNPGVITEEDLMMIREAVCEYFFVSSEIKIIVVDDPRIKETTVLPSKALVKRKMEYIRDLEFSAPFSMAERMGLIFSDGYTINVQLYCGT